MKFLRQVKEEYGRAVKGLSLTDVTGWPSAFHLNSKMDAGDSTSLRAVLRKRAGGGMSIPIVITRLSDGGKVEPDDFPIKYHNGGLEAAVWRGVYAMDRMGAGYWQGIPNRGGGLFAVRWLNPATVKINRDAMGNIESFTRELNGKVERKFVYDFMTDTAVSADGHILGWSWSLGLNEDGPGESIEGIADLPASLLNAMNELTKTFYQRGGINPTIAKTDSNPPPKEKENLRRKISRALFGGLDTAHDVEVFNKNIEFENIGVPPGDWAMTDIDGANLRDVLMAADTPKAIATGEAANRSILDRLVSIWLTTTVFPVANMVIQGHNHHFLEANGYRLTLNVEAMSANQEDERMRANAFALLADRLGNEAALAILGYDIPEGVEIRDNQQPVEVAQPATTEEEESDDTGENEGLRAAELGKLRRYVKKGRHKVRPFHSDVLTPDEIKAVVNELEPEPLPYWLTIKPGDYPAPGHDGN